LGGSPSTGTDGHRQTGGHRFPSTTQYREPTDRSPGPRQGILFRFTPWIFPLTASVPRSPSLGFIPLSSLLPQLCALWSGWPVPQDNWTATTHQRIPSYVSLSTSLTTTPEPPVGGPFPDSRVASSGAPSLIPPDPARSPLNPAWQINPDPLAPGGCWPGGWGPIPARHPLRPRRPDPASCTLPRQSLPSPTRPITVLRDMSPLHLRCTPPPPGGRAAAPGPPGAR